MASSILLLVFAASISLVSCQSDRILRPNDECRGKVMDVFFILDSSSSIYINEFLNQHRIVRDVINRFEVAPRFTRVGMLTYSDDLQRPVIGLTRYPYNNEFNSAVISLENLPYRTGITNTDMAIRYVRQLTEFRQDITKVIVVLTDGGSRSPGQTAREAELARAGGFYLFVIGLGRYLDEREWKAIASDPDDEFIYNITGPRSLVNINVDLPPRMCNLPPIILGRSCDISQPSELYFISPRSTSNAAVSFINTFRRRSRDPRSALRVSYIIEACSNAMSTTLDDDVNCDRFARRTGDSEIAIEEQLQRAIENARASREADPNSNVNQVIVFFVDEDTLDLGSIKFDLTQELRKAETLDGITVVVASLGVRNNIQWARQMALDRGNFIEFESSYNIDEQSDKQMNLLDAICYATNENSSDPDFGGRPN